MTILELMQALSAFDADSIDMAAKAAVQSGIKGSRDIFMAWGADKNIPVSKLQAEWKAAQPEKAASGPRGFADVYYDWLAEASREEQEAHDYIMSNESQNVRNHLTHYLNIWALAETVRRGEKVVRTITAGKASPKAKSSAEPKAKAEPKDTWEYDDSNPFGDERSAWENLKRETKKAKPRKTRLHSDKVAKFGNDELTKAYDHAFKAYCA
jgi:hypothetical protein